MEKKAFSLIELLISLITISVILASMAPVITHKLKHGNTSISAKSIQINCAEKFGTDCMMCNSKSCLWCSTYINVPDGYYIDPSQGCSRKTCNSKFGALCAKCTKDYCLSCISGYGFNSTNYTCNPCYAPYYSPGGTSGCIMCNNGYQYQNLNNQPNCKVCDTANGWFPNSDRKGCTQIKCQKGYRREGNNCVQCAGNTYQPNDNYIGTSCYGCGANLTANDEHTSCACNLVCNDKQYIKNCTCYDCPSVCPVGEYLNGCSCTKCPKGTYSETAGAVACTKCPAGTYADVEGAKSADVCKKCPAGTYSDTEGAAICANCPKGSYISWEGHTKCKKCPMGSYSDTEGAKECTTCPSNLTTSTSYGHTSIKDCAFSCSSVIPGCMDYSCSSIGCYTCKSGYKVSSVSGPDGSFQTCIKK